MAKQASNLVALDGMRRIFSAEQHFSDPWVGSSALNRAGLHLGRVLASAAIDRVRTALALHKWPSPSSAREARDLLARDGIVVLERFLDPARAEALRAELGARFAEADASFPPSACDEHGYGARRPFEAGFDRCDGSTANRFLRIDATRMPESTAFVRDASLLGLLGATVGIRPDPARFFGYRNRLGYDATNHDIQMDLHRDTFQPAFKLWYFVDDVGEDEGPFEYVVGSHRLDAARLAWEHRRAVAASRPGSPDSGGSFRLDPEDLEALSLPAPRAYPVPANTLILANVRGFHRRGRGRPGKGRLGIHASLRTRPFDPRPR